jgi:hypothetical protein
MSRAFVQEERSEEPVACPGPSSCLLARRQVKGVQRISWIMCRFSHPRDHHASAQNAQLVTCFNLSRRCRSGEFPRDAPLPLCLHVDCLVQLRQPLVECLLELLSMTLWRWADAPTQLEFVVARARVPRAPCSPCVPFVCECVRKIIITLASIILIIITIIITAS